MNMNAANFAETLPRPCVLGSELVSQLVSGFSGAFLNNQIGEADLITKIDNKIISASDSHLHAAISHFFKQGDSDAMALAFDVNPDHLDGLKTGLSLKTTLIESTRKVLMLSAITTSMTLDSIENMVLDCLVDLSK